MAKEEFKRKLTAILSADVKDYSLLMGEDEEATVRTITSHRKVITSVIQRYRGRVVDSPGDNILAEFASVVDAVQGAVEIQKVIRAKNARLPDERKMDFRIGINLGDVIHEDDKIYGDGVNIAARVEGLADPGGICISGSAYDQIDTKLDLGYEYIGEHTVKNISKPVRVYKVSPDPDSLQKVAEKRALPLKRPRAVFAALILLALIAGGVGIWRTYWMPAFPSTDAASVEKMEYPLPDQPSIAVLPFDNLSGNPDQEYFSDGLTEDIIAALSSVPKLFVIARNSTFTYKGKPVRIQEVAEELGVRYVLEGSVRKSGVRVRITAQLIDALNGRHLWAERYDRNLSDIFAVQDEITKKIITAMQVKLTEGEEVKAAAKGTNNLEAYLKYLQANELVYSHTPEALDSANKLAEEALALDPRYASAYCVLAKTHVEAVFLGTSESSEKSLQKAKQLVQKAISLDDNLAEAHALLGYIYSLTWEHDKALVHGEKAVTLNPNSAESHMRYGQILTFAGRYKEAIRQLESAIRLNPLPPNIYLYSLGISYCWTGQFDKAITWCEKAVHEEPNSLFARLFMAMAYSLAGQQEKAQTEAQEVLRINPNFSLAKFAEKLNYSNQEDKIRLLVALREAGLN